jgi:hypothetical protein
VRAVQPADLDRVRDMIDELCAMREGAKAPLYGHVSGDISSLRAILRAHGRGSEPDR